jgi:hypothetical protein
MTCPLIGRRQKAGSYLGLPETKPVVGTDCSQFHPARTQPSEQKDDASDAEGCENGLIFSSETPFSGDPTPCCGL